MIKGQQVKRTVREKQEREEMNESANNATEQKAKFSKLAIASFILAVIPFACMVAQLFTLDIDIFFKSATYLFTKKLLFPYDKFYIWIYLFIGFPGSLFLSIMSVVFSVWGINNIIKSKGTLRGVVFAELGLGMASIILWSYVYILQIYIGGFPSPT